MKLHVAKIASSNFKKYKYANHTIDASDWREAREKCLKRDNYSCRKCSAKSFTCHHIVPVSKGGRNSLSNLITLCGACHQKEHKHLFKQAKTNRFHQ